MMEELHDQVAEMKIFYLHLFIFQIYNLCIFIVLGCMINLDSVLKISDAIIFIVAIPNIIGLYLLAPLVKKELKEYKEQIGDIS